MHNGKTQTSTALIVAAVAVLAVAGVLALVDGHVSGRAFAAAVLGLGVATAALAANTRAVGTGLAVAVERAPRAEYYRGYGDAAQDARRSDNPDDDLDDRSP